VKRREQSKIGRVRPRSFLAATADQMTILPLLFTVSRSLPRRAGWPCLPGRV
jgi:hypothetical protein